MYVHRHRVTSPFIERGHYDDDKIMPHMTLGGLLNSIHRYGQLARL